MENVAHGLDASASVKPPAGDFQQLGLKPAANAQELLMPSAASLWLKLTSMLGLMPSASRCMMCRPDFQQMTVWMKFHSYTVACITGVHAAIKGCQGC